LGMLRWDEIESIQVFRRSSPCLGIIPRDVDALMQRYKPLQRWQMKSAAERLKQGKWRDRFYSPFCIPQRYMYITADELIEHIRSFQLRYYPTGPLAGDDPNTDPAAWPPAPGGRRG